VRVMNENRIRTRIYMRSVAALGVIVSLILIPFGGQQAAAPSKRRQVIQQSTLLTAKIRKKEIVTHLERLIPQLMNEGDVPGLSIALIREAKVFWQKGFGVKHAQTKEPLDKSTVFEAASLSKPVFAYAVLKLVDSGKLDLDAPLIKYYAGAYTQTDERANLITARMVLTHTTGFQNEVTPGQSLEIHFTPGEKFSYSGEGFLYLQKVVDHLTGERFDIFMKRTVFDPLRMTSSGYLWEPRYDRLEAYGHNASDQVADRIKPSEAKMSGLHTTPGDYAKFVIAIMNGTGLKKETTREMLKTQVRVDESCSFCINRRTGRFSPSLSWGLGWGLEHTDTGDAFWHWGENRGEFQTFVIAYPKQRVGIVIFTNSGNGFSIIPEIVSQAIGGKHPGFAWMGYELYNSAEFLKRRTEIRAAKTLYEAMLVRGTTALEEYRERRKTLSSTEVLGEPRMNSIGYWLLGKKKIKEAIEVFKMNVEDYPKSWNAYDSLGDGYIAGDNKPEALKNYQRSLALNPGNDNARQMIQILERE
jgi:CubicO group peptidase (beta-lactamase class C family)